MTVILVMTNEDLGYNQYFENSRQKLGFGGHTIARVTNERKGFYIVKNNKSEYFARVTGKSMFTSTSKSDFPVVGDWVAVTILDDENVTVNGILDRYSILERRRVGRDSSKVDIQPISSNIDFAFIVESVDRDYSLNRIERYLSLASTSKIVPIIILNKIDLIAEDNLQQKISEIKERFQDIAVISLSTLSESGISEIQKLLLHGKTYCLLGSSGVGKSSIINSLLGDSSIKTGEISTHSNRGRHTTTDRQMYFLRNGAIIIDNPGIKEIGIGDDFINSNLHFEDINNSTSCKFSNCTHTSEPGCQIIKLLESGEINRDKYENFIKLRSEKNFYEMSKHEKREKDKAFGKFKNRVIKDMKNFE